MTSKAVQEVVAELDSHRLRFEEFCRALSAEELERSVPQSTWIVRDFIAHLGTIDGPVGLMFDSMHSGGNASMQEGDGGQFDIDRWNDRQVEPRRLWPLEDVLAEAASEREVLRGKLLALTDEDLARTMKFGGDSKRPSTEIPFEAYLRGWCKHDPMHAMDMSRALPERQAGLAAWFDDPVIQGYQKAMNR